MAGNSGNPFNRPTEVKVGEYCFRIVRCPLVASERHTWLLVQLGLSAEERQNLEMLSSMDEPERKVISEKLKLGRLLKLSDPDFQRQAFERACAVVCQGVVGYLDGETWKDHRFCATPEEEGEHTIYVRALDDHTIVTLADLIWSYTTGGAQAKTYLDRFRYEPVGGGIGSSGSPVRDEAVSSPGGVA